MCGIAGFWDQRGTLAADAMPATLRRMTDAVRHRGPDDEGIWSDPKCGIALGHRRLSIIDVSPAGHQPMVSADGRYWIVFNGEIYNFEDLRRELESEGVAQWRGHSDTEVLLAAFGRWGVQQTLQRTVGMFAFALWDTKERTLTLARDRVGEKPLYYGWHQGVLLFASELKAISAFDGWCGSLDRAATAGYFRFGYVPAPRSIYNEVAKVPAAHLLTVREGQRVDPPVPYWSVRNVTENPNSGKFETDERVLVEELDHLLRRSIARQMISDVPLGAFLSGGIDSSTVVALMQKQSSRPVRTFSIGFREEGFDEAGYARAIAAHLGTDHTEFYVTAQDAIDVVPQLASLSDEPFADSSLIPTLMVARLARRYVTVALSGDGGDELFAGYTRYPMAQRVVRGLALIPAPLRYALARAIEATKPEYLERIGQWIAPLVPRAYQFKSFADRLYKAAEVLPLADVPRFYRRLVAQWPDPAEVFLDSPPTESLIDSDGYFARFASDIDAMRALDLQTYLPDDILVKIDRSAMSTSLETRVPLLDQGLIEFAWRVPVWMHIQGDQTKRLLRKVLYRYVPPALVERPKMGFGLPIGIWLRGPLRDWAEDLLAEQRLRDDGLLNVAAVRRYWLQHVAGERNWQYRLWCVLMFQAWRASLAAA